MNAIRTILVPYDFSEYSREALEIAVDLAGQLMARTLYLLHVVKPPLYLHADAFAALTIPLESAVPHAERRLEEAVAGLANLPLRPECRVVEAERINDAF